MMTTIPLNDATSEVHTKMAHRNSTGTVETFESDDKTLDSDDKGLDEAPIANFDGLKADLEAAATGSEIDDKSQRGGGIDQSNSTSSGGDSGKDTTTKSDGTTSCTGGPNGSSSGSKFSLGRKESADIVKLRALVITILLISAVAVSVVVYVMSKNAEVDNYNDQYDATVKGKNMFPF